MTLLLKIWKGLVHICIHIKNYWLQKQKSMIWIKVGKIILKLTFLRYIGTSKSQSNTILEIQSQSANFFKITILQQQNWLTQPKSSMRNLCYPLILWITATEFLTIQILVFHKRFNVYEIPGWVMLIRISKYLLLHIFTWLS